MSLSTIKNTSYSTLERIEKKINILNSLKQKLNGLIDCDDTINNNEMNNDKSNLKHIKTINKNDKFISIHEFNMEKDDEMMPDEINEITKSIENVLNFDNCSSDDSSQDENNTNNNNDNCQNKNNPDCRHCKGKGCIFCYEDKNENDSNINSKKKCCCCCCCEKNKKKKFIKQKILQAKMRNKLKNKQDTEKKNEAKQKKKNKRNKKKNKELFTDEELDKIFDKSVDEIIQEQKNEIYKKK